MQSLTNPFSKYMELLRLGESPHVVKEEHRKQLRIEPLLRAATKHRRFGQRNNAKWWMDLQKASCHSNDKKTFWKES